MSKNLSQNLLLCHFGEAELRAMDLLQGGQSIDPDTGLREYSKLGRVIEKPEVLEGIVRTLQELSGKGDEYNSEQLAEEIDSILPELPKVPSDQELSEIEHTGREGDKYLALVPKIVVNLFIHINGGYSLNPKTGLLEFFLGGLFKGIGKVAKSIVGGIKNVAKNLPVVGSLIKGISGDDDGFGGIVPGLVGGHFAQKAAAERIKHEKDMYAKEMERIEAEKKQQGVYLVHDPLMKQMSVNDYNKQGRLQAVLGATHEGVNPEAQRKHNLAQAAFEIAGLDPPAYVSQYVPMSETRRRALQRMAQIYQGPDIVQEMYQKVPAAKRSDSLWRPFKKGGAVTPLRSYIQSSGIYGKGKGQDDTIKTSLPSGSYIIDATTTAHLGDGSSSAGIKALESMAHQIKKSYPSSFVGQIEGHLKKTQRQTPVYLSHEEFKFDPVTVALAGGGNLQKGVSHFRQMVQNVRRHKASKGLDLPPKAKAPLHYLPRG